MFPARFIREVSSDTKRDFYLRCLISAFILTHFGITLIWLLPQTPIRRQILEQCKYTWSFLGFDQRWELFAPNTRETNCHTVMLITFENGSSTIWPLPRMDLLAYDQKYLRDKFRKWGTDNLPWEDHREYWPDFARYTGRIHYRKGNPPVSAVFIVFESQIPKLDSAFTSREQLPLHSQWRTAFCYRFKPEDFR